LTLACGQSGRISLPEEVAVVLVMVFILLWSMETQAYAKEAARRTGYWRAAVLA